ncbi:MAG: adenylate/guanylate cyclase domain-containing protein [Burkholderiales bacterium]|nr:adenylate/guanylate cyclase domain-containing protein [Burkholderiales bacterium]
MSYATTLLQRLRTAGVEPSDSEDVKLKKQLLMFAMGLMTATPVLWLALYWMMGLDVSASLPFGYQLVSLATLITYLVTLNFNFFRAAQLVLFLFFPFVLQWKLGNFITASGVVLWGLLAPIGAILLYSPRESIPWFVAYVVLIAASAAIDYQLAGVVTVPAIPERASVVFFALNFIGMSSIVYFLLRFSTAERDKSQAHLEETHRALQAEQERSERLLLNILPGPVAERLKQDEGTIADGFADVTVMFADIVNFTTIAEGMSPNQIFSMLNKVFSSFDALAEKHGLEKIKTIGDAYMVAGGLDTDDSTNYSEKIALMALEMRDMLEHDLGVNEHRLQIRMGIGTGPVVAGVVGKKKFIYDLWGDTVNLASRITSEAVPGMIQVDATTYRRLRAKFDFDPPHTVYLKGKGDTVIYRMRGLKSDEAPRAAASG